MTDFENDIRMARQIASRAEELGGRTYFVGGYVRDTLLQRENKDVDIEVHGIAPRQLETVLDSLGQRLEMGESFGIYMLKGYSLDIAMPRGENDEPDPFTGAHEAARRRDLTINAMMQDVLTGEVLDFFCGREDLNAGVLRHVDAETFVRDPLRVLRTAQFAARFGFTVAEDMIDLCSTIDLSGIARERVEAELKKALLKSPRPSVFFDVLRRMGQLSCWFAEVEALIGVEQNLRFHAEGDVYTHTMMVLDEAAAFKERVKDPFALMLAAAAHDFGKAICTEVIDGVIHAYKHETLGLPLVQAFMERITNEQKLIEQVMNLTELHMKPIVQVKAGSSVKSMNKMFDQAIDPEALIAIALADDLGRFPRRTDLDFDAMLHRHLAVYRENMARPYVMGRDLVQAGLKPGPEFTELLAYAHKLRLAGVEKENALKQTLAYARNLKKHNEK